MNKIENIDLNADEAEPVQGDLMDQLRSETLGNESDSFLPDAEAQEDITSTGSFRMLTKEMLERIEDNPEVQGIMTEDTLKNDNNFETL